MAKRKFIRTKAGSYVPEFMVVKDGAGNEKSIVRGSVKKQPAKVVATKHIENPKSVDLKSEFSDIAADDFSGEIPLEKSNKKIYYVGLGALIVIIFMTLVLFYFRSRLPVQKSEEIAVDINQEVQDNPIDIQENTADETTTTDESVQLERGDISIEILNGSGTSGLAGKEKEVFLGLGYKNISVGNTAVTVGNKIYLNGNVEGKVDVLLEDVKSELNIASVSGSIDEEGLDARIILGK